MAETSLAPLDADDAAAALYEERRVALLTLIGAEKLNEPQRELYLSIAAKYDLVAELRHLVIIDGKPYITRDGLLHVAHKSGDFDGIEVEQPVLDADGKFWRTKATVWRKSFGRPFSYPGRYPATGGNQKYNEEMCIKVAEVMTLRRAFDVAAPVIEERWDGEIEADGAEIEQPKTLADRVAQRVAQLQPSEPAVITPTEVVQVLDALVADGTIPAEARAAISVAPEPEEATEAPVEVAETTETTPEAELAEADGQAVAEEERELGAFDAKQPDPNDGPTLEEFSALVAGADMTRVRAIADKVHPGAAGWREFTRHELGVVIDTLASEELDDVPEPEPATPDEQATFEADLAAKSAAAQAEPVKAPAGITFCGAKSPYDDGQTCTMDKGHGGPHRVGMRVSW